MVFFVGLIRFFEFGVLDGIGVDFWVVDVNFYGVGLSGFVEDGEDWVGGVGGVVEGEVWVG